MGAGRGQSRRVSIAQRRGLQDEYENLVLSRFATGYYVPPAEDEHHTDLVGQQIVIPAGTPTVQVQSGFGERQLELPRGQEFTVILPEGAGHTWELTQQAQRTEITHIFLRTHQSVGGDEGVSYEMLRWRAPTGHWREAPAELLASYNNHLESLHLVNGPAADKVSF